MKRSELINQLIAKIGPLGLSHAEDVLKLIEGAGMLPPIHPDTISSMPLNHLEALLDQVDEDFKWENEDVGQ